MTEQEAKRTRCCGSQGCGEPRNVGEGSAATIQRFCIGSACMAWRVDRVENGALLETKPCAPGSTIPGPDWGYDMRTHSWTLHEKTQHGYCGLAGKP